MHHLNVDFQKFISAQNFKWLNHIFLKTYDSLDQIERDSTGAIKAMSADCDRPHFFNQNITIN